MKPRPRVVAAACLLAAATIGTSIAAHAADASEAEIKAAFLCKFGDYVEWPASAASATAASFSIAIAGNEAEAEVLQRVAAGTNVGGHPVHVRRLAAGESLHDERIVYVTHSQTARAGELTPVAQELGVLLVTEVAEPGLHAGMVNFVVEDNKVRFDVDLAKAAGARLKLSARLLSVARRVIGGVP